MSIAQTAARNLPTLGDVAICDANDPVETAKVYVHPVIIDAYMDGSLLNFLKQHAEREKKPAKEGLRHEESLVLAFLEQEAKK